MIMSGMKLTDRKINFTQEIIPTHYSLKEAVFPFAKFRGTDILLGPEMKSTGEVMGIDDDFGLAYAKSQMAAAPPLPLSGNVFISVRDADKHAIPELARGLQALGFWVYSTSGTATTLETAGVPVVRLFKLNEGRPNVLDMLKNGDIALIINTPAGPVARQDEVKIRTNRSLSARAGDDDPGRSAGNVEGLAVAQVQAAWREVLAGVSFFVDL